jgi:hypothetical protein
MILGDAGIHKVGKEAYIKFEQGYKQQNFIEDLFNKFKLYTFMDNLGIRYEKNDKLTIKVIDLKLIVMKLLQIYEKYFIYLTLIKRVKKNIKKMLLLVLLKKNWMK